MFEKIKQFRSTIASHDLTWWEVGPLILAMFVPNIFEPVWAWRIGAYIFLIIAFIFICIRGMFAPEQFFKNTYSNLTRFQRYLFWVAYPSVIIGFFFGVRLLSTGPVPDSYRYFMTPESAFARKEIQIVTTKGGGAIAPYFLKQTLVTAEEQYTFPLSFYRPKPGTKLLIIYSPYTNIVYEVQQIK